MQIKEMNQIPKVIYPKVVSASRATDIPAFHARWFMERLKAGFCEWQNHFNAHQKQLVAFDETQAIVFWSKNPRPLIPYLSEITDMGKIFYFQFTLNNYERENLEPGIPALEERIKTLEKLAQKYKVIWRYDPVVMGERLTVKRHIQIIDAIMRQVGGLTDKLVFSFVDLYGRVKTNLRKQNSDFRAPTEEEMKIFSLELVKLRDKIAPKLKLASCAETDIDFSELGIEKNSCIDAPLINKLCGKKIFKEKNEKATQGNLFAGEASALIQKVVYEKDKGQREACQCAPSKDIGSYHSHPCGHHCVYCYAGHTKK